MCSARLVSSHLMLQLTTLKVSSEECGKYAKKQLITETIQVMYM